MFDDLEEMVQNWGKFPPLTDEQYQTSCVNDIQEWAESISGEWNGKDSGHIEDRASCANDIIAKCNELKELIAEMENL